MRLDSCAIGFTPVSISSLSFFYATYSFQLLFHISLVFLSQSAFLKSAFLKSAFLLIPSSFFSKIPYRF